jgi:DNA-binding transcriptional regulator YiaG
METLSGPAFEAILNQADLNQAEFGRITGITARQVNNWCRERAAVPRWAALLAIALRELSPEALVILLQELSCTSEIEGT